MSPLQGFVWWRYLPTQGLHPGLSNPEFSGFVLGILPYFYKFLSSLAFEKKGCKPSYSPGCEPWGL